MSQLANTINTSTIEQVVLKGDLAQLSPEQRLSYYKQVCESVGLNPLTQPFQYLTLNGRMVLYATRACSEQLRTIYNVSVVIATRSKEGELYVVTAKATLPSGRTDESLGAVNVMGLKGDALANAFMKAETKAKRRVTLSICGLSFLDETEVEDIPEVKKSKAANVPPPGPAKETAPVEPSGEYPDAPFFDEAEPLPNIPSGHTKFSAGQHAGKSFQEVYVNDTKNGLTYTTNLMKLVAEAKGNVPPIVRDYLAYADAISGH